MDEPMRTICPTCEGEGVVKVPHAAVRISLRESDDPGTGPFYTPPADTVLVEEKCKTCDGHGTLKGFQAPT